jgi:hypothetical protein
MSDPLSDAVPTLRPVTDFDYRPEPGFLVEWGVYVSGYLNQFDGEWDWDDFRRLSDIELAIEATEDEYKADTGASLTRVHGSHGWRVYEWDDGAVHRYEWKHAVRDRRCPRCKSPAVTAVYMVTDELWASSGLDGWACFRCLEEAIGRRLVPADFKPGLPCNSEEAHHGPELRTRMELT